MASPSTPSRANPARNGDPDRCQRTYNPKLRNSGKTPQQPRDQTSARLTNGEAAAGFSSLGELRVSFGLLLLRLAARSSCDSGAGEGT